MASGNIYHSATWRQLLLRRKAIDLSPTALARKLGALDLTFLGAGATLGAGAYVLVGVIASGTSGPAVVLSFLISGVASILSALCYAEFGARVPRAGSAYVYSYVTVGEVMAWTTGWQLLLEYIIGASSVARAWSGYVDFLANGAISTALNNAVGNWGVSGLAEYPDFLAAGMTMLLACVCAVGVRESTIVNNVLTATNVLVIGFVIVAGAVYAEPSNMTPFAPFGVSGIFSGAATAFFSYVGFDVIATSAEEARNPSRNVPFAIIVSLCMCMAMYMAVSAVGVMMVPYAEIKVTAPLAMAFSRYGANWAVYIIAVGAICGLTTSLMTSIFPMPRIVYAIASDGLLPEWMGRVHPKFNTPVAATLLCGSLAAILALIFDLATLAEMMSIGTLLAYTLVSASVLVLRYREYDDARAAAARAAHGVPLLADGLHVADGAAASGSGVVSPAPRGAPPARLPRVLPVSLPDGHVGLWGAQWTAYAAAGTTLMLYTFGSAVLATMLVVLQQYTLSAPAVRTLYAIMALAGCLLAYTATILYLLPRATPTHIDFVAPLVPALPLVSVFVNVYLLVSLTPMTWVRFAVWCTLGTAIYLFYGVRHSKAPVTSDHRYHRVGSMEDEFHLDHSRPTAGSVAGVQLHEYDPVASSGGAKVVATNGDHLT